MASVHEPPKILVVNDEAPIRLLCRVNLESEGFDVEEAADGPSGLATARDEKPDLILLDTMMPGLDGWRVAEQLGAGPDTQDIPIVFVAPRPPKGDRDYARAFDLGAVDYLTLPFNPLELAPRVRQILDRISPGEREDLRRERLAELVASEGEGASEAAATAGFSRGVALPARMTRPRWRELLVGFLASVPGALGAIAVAAFVGAGIYFGIIHPSLAYDQDQSYAWTQDCIDRGGGIEMDDSIAKLFDVPGVRALGMKSQGERAVVLFANSTATARQGERELRQGLRQRGASLERINRQLVREGPELMLYALRPPSTRTRRAFAECVYLIEQNRWTGWTGFDSKAVGRHRFYPPRRPHDRRRHLCIHGCSICRSRSRTHRPVGVRRVQESQGQFRSARLVVVAPALGDRLRRSVNRRSNGAGQRRQLEADEQGECSDRAGAARRSFHASARAMRTCGVWVSISDLPCPPRLSASQRRTNFTTKTAYLQGKGYKGYIVTNGQRPPDWVAAAAKGAEGIARGQKPRVPNPSHPS